MPRCNNESGTIHYWSRDAHKQWWKNLKREPSFEIGVSVHVTQFPASISASACRTMHFLHSKKGPQIHTLRQTAHYRRRHHIKSERVEKRSVFDGENREEKKKSEPKRVLVCFQVGAVKPPPTPPCKVDQRISRLREVTSRRIAHAENAFQAPPP